MAAPPVEFKDVDGVVDGFTMHGSPYFSIWQSNTLKLCCDKEEPAEAEDMLRDCLAAIEQSGTTAIYTLRVHPDAKNFNTKKNYKGSFTFRLNDGSYNPEKQQGGGVNTSPNFVMLSGTKPAAPGSVLEQALMKMMETQTLILEKLSKLEEPEDDEDEDEEDEETEEEILERKLQFYSGMAEKFQPMISGILDKIFPGNSSNYSPQNIGEVAKQTTPPPATPEEANQRMMAAITKLNEVLGTETLVDALEKLACMPPMKLKGALAFL